MPRGQTEAPYPPISGEEAIDLVVGEFPVVRDELIGRSRRRRIVRARQALCWMLYYRGKPGSGIHRSYSDVGAITRMDFSSALHAVRRAGEVAQREPLFAERLQYLAQVLPGSAPRREIARRRQPEQRSEPARQMQEVEPSPAECAVAASVTRYGERVNDDDRGARMRAAGSIALREAILAARPQGHDFSIPAERSAVNAPARSGRGPGAGLARPRGFHDERIA